MAQWAHPATCSAGRRHPCRIWRRHLTSVPLAMQLAHRRRAVPRAARARQRRLTRPGARAAVPAHAGAARLLSSGSPYYRGRRAACSKSRWLRQPCCASSQRLAARPPRPFSSFLAANSLRPATFPVHRTKPSPAWSGAAVAWRCSILAGARHCATLCSRGRGRWNASC